MSVWASCSRFEAAHMRPWKAVVGVGAACAVCCAVPLLGGVAAFTAGSTALAAIGSAWLACADEFGPLAGVLLALAAAGGGLVWWRRRAARKAQAQAGCGVVCHVTEPRTSCDCAPGASG